MERSSRLNQFELVVRQSLEEEIGQMTPPASVWRRVSLRINPPTERWDLYSLMYTPTIRWLFV